MNKIVDLSINNQLWNDSQWYCEEQFSGLQVNFKFTKSLNLIEAHDKNLHHCFQEYRDLPLYGLLKDTTFSAVITAPEGVGRRYIKTLVNSGVMGAERLQHQNGHIRLVLTDILMLGGIDLSGFRFKDRRIYLESLTTLLVEQGLTKYIVISDIIKTDKLQFFKFIQERGARGVILKNSSGVYGEDSFKVIANTKDKGAGNVTLNRNWQSLEKKIEPLEDFDYDTFLAVQFLNKPKNEIFLSSVLT
jgi:hypothetical protein